MQNKKMRAAMLCGSLAAVMGVSGMLAYFTDADTATNEFTFGKVTIDLQEPNWDPDEPTSVTPNQTIEKDPQIKNDGVNDAYVFLKVSVPYKNIVTANADGTKNAAADTELFSYTVNSGWVQVGSDSKDESAGTVTRIYAYATDGAMTTLAANATTPALFDSVTVCNAVEDQGLEETTEDIVIDAYAIQTNDINGGKTAPADVWTVVNNQSPSTAVDATEDDQDIKQ